MSSSTRRESPLVRLHQEKGLQPGEYAPFLVTSVSRGGIDGFTLAKVYLNYLAS